MAEFKRAESKRAPHALLSISFFFFLLVFFSSWLPYLPYHADLHFCLLLIDLSDCFWVDRKFMFLLCNLILVVIAMESGLLASFMPERGHGDELSVRKEGQLSLQGGPDKFRLLATSASTPQVRSLENGAEPLEPAAEAATTAAAAEEEQEEVEELEHQQQQEEKDWDSDMDELNKRFDEFIAKVRRDMVLV